jgi:hypothetical protein
MLFLVILFIKYNKLRIYRIIFLKSEGISGSDFSAIVVEPSGT